MAKAELLYAGTRDGVVMFSEPGGIGRWLRIGHALRGEAIASCWLQSDNLQIALVSGTTAVWRTEDGGQTWAEQPGALPGLLARDPSQANRIWSAGEGNLARSDDGGVTWTVVASGAWSFPNAIAANTADVAFASQDALLVFDFAHDALRTEPVPAAPISALVRSPGLERAWYAIAGGAAFLMLADTWRRLEGAPDEVASLAVLGGKQPTVLLGLPSGQIVRNTADGWEASQLPAGWPQQPPVLSPAPYHIDTAFAASGGAVAVTTDRGRTWSVLRSDLPAVTYLVAGRLA